MDQQAGNRDFADGLGRGDAFDAMVALVRGADGRGSARIHPPPLRPGGDLFRGHIALSALLARRRPPAVAAVAAAAAGIDRYAGYATQALRSQPAAAPDLPATRGEAGDWRLEPPREPMSFHRTEPRRRSSAGLSFLLLVCLPTALVGLYYAGVAKKEYASEFRFSVIEQTTALPSAAQSPSNSIAGGSASAGIATVTAALTGNATQGNGSVQNFMVIDYVQSPAVVDALEQRIKLGELLYKGDDLLVRFAAHPTQEQLYTEWQRVVSAYYDPITSLAYVKVHAFTPADSVLIATTLMKLSEDLINMIANRANADAVKYAADEVERSRRRVADAAESLRSYRNGDQVIDPTSMAVAPNIALLTSLRQNVAMVETQVNALIAQRFSRDSPTVKYYAAQLDAAKAQLRQVEAEVKDTRDGKTALSSIVGKYEALDLNRQYANLAYTNAMLALDQTRANAAAQHVYLTPYSQPILPRAPAGPNVLQAVLSTFFGLAFTWFILLMVLRSVRDARI